MDIKRAKLTMEKDPPKITGEILQAVVLYADIRNYSDWITTVSQKQAAELIQAIYERVIQLNIDYYHDFYKYLGDGYLLVWEVDSDLPIENAVNLAVGAAFEIHKKYWYLAKDLEYPAPEGMGHSTVVTTEKYAEFSLRKLAEDFPSVNNRNNGENR